MKFARKSMFAEMSARGGMQFAVFIVCARADGFVYICNICADYDV